MKNFLDSLERECRQATIPYLNDLLSRAHEYQRFIIRLILDSPQNAAKAQEPWQYKSIVQYASESFATQSAYRLTTSSRVLREDFIEQASRVFGEQLYIRLSDVKEGLRLYILRDGQYVEGDASHDDWRFVHDLIEQGFDLEQSVYEPPRWTRTLFLGYENWRVWRALWSDYSCLPPGEYMFGKKIRVAAIDAYHSGLLEPGHGTQPSIEYPLELRAAIESFNAMHGNPSATAKRSPKAALLAWLEENKPELSANARERVATVANWQPTGGAPKTSGK